MSGKHSPFRADGLAVGLHFNCLRNLPPEHQTLVNKFEAKVVKVLRNEYTEYEKESDQAVISHIHTVCAHYLEYLRCVSFLIVCPAKYCVCLLISNNRRVERKVRLQFDSSPAWLSVGFFEKASEMESRTNQGLSRAIFLRHCSSWFSFLDILRLARLSIPSFFWLSVPLDDVGMRSECECGVALLHASSGIHSQSRCNVSFGRDAVHRHVQKKMLTSFRP